MNIPVNFAKWSATNLPAGLKIKNGVISGQTTAETGIYTVPFSVITPWGRDTKNITINVREKSKFAIYQNGAKLEDISLNELVASIRNGTAQEKYNCINTQMMIPIFTPKLNFFDYETDSPQYDTVALNFCSFRNVTLADGTVKPALILQFDKTLWEGFCCFDTGDKIIKTDRSYEEIYDWEFEWLDRNSVTNRWRYSNLRQWLNSAGENWFSPAYDTDVLLTDDDVKSYSLMRNPDSIGFLSCLPQDLVECIQPIKIQTQAFFNEDNFDETIEEPDTINGVYVDITYDKIFIPSLEEMNVKPSDNDGYSNGKKIYADDGIEGTAWEYYINKFGSQSRVIGGTTINGISEWGRSLYGCQELPHEEWGYAHFTRSAILNSNIEIWNVISQQDNTLEIAPNYFVVMLDGGTMYAYNYNPAPAFALC